MKIITSKKNKQEKQAKRREINKKSSKIYHFNRWFIYFSFTLIQDFKISKITYNYLMCNIEREVIISSQINAGINDSS